LGKIVKIWVKFDYIWVKIKILHNQKHSTTYGYVNKPMYSITWLLSIKILWSK